MEIFWQWFWPVFWIMVFIGLALTFYYLIRNLRELFIIMKTASDVSEQIRAISDLVEDMRTKAKMGVFVDVLEMSKRLFMKMKGHDKHNSDE